MRSPLMDEILETALGPAAAAELLREAYADFSHERLLRLFTKAPKACWRFDVDVSLAAAVKMARFAQVAGIRATTYLNPRCDFYNLFSREGEQAVSEIVRAGHRLGLHCDYRNGSVMGRVLADYALINTAYGPLFSRAVSFHMPPTCVLWVDQPEFESAYASRWEGRYLSDSRREFGADKEALVSDCYQIALHAEHWFP